MDIKMTDFSPFDFRAYPGAEDIDGKLPRIVRFEVEGRKITIIEDNNGTYVEIILINEVLPDIMWATDEKIGDKILKDFPTKFLSIRKYMERPNINRV